MPRVCTVCSHPEREKIDKSIVEAAPNRRVAAQHGLTEQAVRRHRSHIGAALQAASERLELHADDLLGQAREINRDLREMLAAAKESESLGAALQVVDRLQKQFAVQATLLDRAGLTGDGNVTYAWDDGAPRTPEVLPPEATKETR